MKICSFLVEAKDVGGQLTSAQLDSVVWVTAALASVLEQLCSMKCRMLSSSSKVLRTDVSSTVNSVPNGNVHFCEVARTAGSICALLLQAEAGTCGSRPPIPTTRRNRQGHSVWALRPCQKLCRLFNQSILKSAVQALFAVFVAKCFLLLAVQQPCWQHCYSQAQAPEQRW